MSLLKFLGLTTTILFSLFGCSSVKENMVPAKLGKISASYKFKDEWSNFVGVGQDARYQRLQPLIYNKFLYTVDVKGHVKQLDPSNGDIKWTLDLNTSIGGGVGSGGGLIFVGSLSGEVIAIDPQTGTEKWRAQSSTEIVSAPQANDEVVVVSAIDGRVFAYDIKDGALKWNYDHAEPILSLRSNASPLVSTNNVFIGFDNGQLLNFNCGNGQLIWSARVGQPQGKTELDRLVDIDASPIEFGPYIYAAGYNSRVIAVTRGSGTIMWAQDVSTTQNIAAMDNTVVVVDAESHIKAFDALNGTMLWEDKHLHRRNVTAPVIIGGLVVVIDFDGVLHGLSLKTGEVVARLSTRYSSVVSQPIVYNNLFYVLDTHGEIAAFSFAEIKKVSGNDEIETPLQASPVINTESGSEVK